MRVPQDDVPVKINAPGAVARQRTEFGDATGCGKISGEYFSFAAGTDINSLLHGLEGNLCQCPHWGYVLKGELTTTFPNGDRETTREKDLSYWPSGHTVKAEADAEIVLFSPQKEHTHVMDHILGRING